MSITQDKLFSDSMQITRKQGNYDADGSIVDTNSVIWKSCLSLALQELTKDLLPLKESASGSTIGESLLDISVQYITKPTDFYSMQCLYYANTLQKQITHTELFSAGKEGYCIDDSKIYINSDRSDRYYLKYYAKWPMSGTEASTNLSILDDMYYMTLLWQLIKQIYLFYEDVDGASVAQGVYDRAKDNVSGTAITQILSIHSSRG